VSILNLLFSTNVPAGNFVFVFLRLNFSFNLNVGSSFCTGILFFAGRTLNEALTVLSVTLAPRLSAFLAGKGLILTCMNLSARFSPSRTSTLNPFILRRPSLSISISGRGTKGVGGTLEGGEIIDGGGESVGDTGGDIVGDGAGEGAGEGGGDIVGLGICEGIGDINPETAGEGTGLGRGLGLGLGLGETLI